jgi:hypothetical protein
MNKLVKASNYYKTAAEELLKKWAPSYSNIEQRLNDIGLIPIPHGEDDSFVGAGIQAKAFEVLYNGKRAIAKVIPSPDDIVQYITMKNLLKIMPKKYAKHFAEIYDIIEDEEIGYIVVMELLHPVDVGTLTINFAQEEYEPDLFKNKVNILAKNMLFNESEGKDAIKEVVSNLYPTLSSEELSTIVDQCELEIKEMFEALLDYDRYEIISYFQKLANAINRNLPQEIKMEHSSRFSFFMRKFLEETFPKFSSLGGNLHGNEKVESLFDALNFIEEEYGILWGDMHGGNIMQKSNGDLAVIDYGLFQ